MLMSTLTIIFLIIALFVVSCSKISGECSREEEIYQQGFQDGVNSVPVAEFEFDYNAEDD